MKKSFLVITGVMLLLTVASCGWLSRQGIGVGDQSSVKPRTQMCPDDPMYCK